VNLPSSDAPGRHYPDTPQTRRCSTGATPRKREDGHGTQTQLHKPALPGSPAFGIRARGPHRPRRPQGKEHRRWACARPGWHLATAVEVDISDTRSMKVFGCDRCYGEDAATIWANLNVVLETVTTLVDKSRFDVSIRRCQTCQQQFVFVFTEISTARRHSPRGQISTGRPPSRHSRRGYRRSASPLGARLRDDSRAPPSPRIRQHQHQQQPTRSGATSSVRAGANANGRSDQPCRGGHRARHRSCRGTHRQSRRGPA
jgi:hypothetical protein